MGKNISPPDVNVRKLFGFIARILGPEKNFYWLAIVYGVGISLLSLAIPISVQMLINTVANIGLTTPLVVLTMSLFGLLLIGGLLNALRLHLMDIFGRRFYARMVAEIAMCSLYAKNPFFHDHSDGPLFNRYFDIVIVQKTLPSLLTGGFTIILQAVVGFALVSMYHPLFLAFNLVFIGCIVLVWLIWGRKGIVTAVQLSHSKHAGAAWLESIAASNGFFKSKSHIAYALDRTEVMTADYISKHRAHFRTHFTQTLMFLVMYAVASAALLGLGGWLVIGGQLTLGQLVAAELVLSAVFFGISQLGIYLSYFYDICAAIDELSLFYDVEQEEPRGDERPQRGDASLEFAGVRGDARGEQALLNMQFDSGQRVLAQASSHGLQRLVANLIRRHVDPDGGYIAIGGVDIQATEVHLLRREVMVLHRISAVEMSLRDFLTLGTEGEEPERVLAVIRAVGLEQSIARLPRGLDTVIAATGWPLSTLETLKLKLAAAVLAKPRILVLNQLFDMVPSSALKGAFDMLQSHVQCTVLYFSNAWRDLDFSHYVYIELDRQRIFTTVEDFTEVVDDGGDHLMHHQRLLEVTR